MEQQIKVSVVMPVYNVSQYLEKCLDTLVNQTLKEIEIICVNDGSKDNSLEILERYASEDKRIIVINQENAGAATARNNGMTYARGKYLSIVDSDDFFDLEMLRKAYEMSEKYDCEVTMFNVFGYDNNTSEIWKWEGINRYYWSLAGGEELLINDGKVNVFEISTGAAWNKLFRRDFIEKNKIQFQKNPPSDEIYFSLIATLLAKRIAVLDERLLYYRLGNSDSQVGRSRLFPYSTYNALCAIKNEMEEIIADYSDERAKKIKRFFSRYAFWKDRVTLESLKRTNLVEKENMSAFEEMYYEITEKHSKEFGFDDLDESDFASEGSFKIYERMFRTNPVEYLAETLREKVNKYCYQKNYSIPYDAMERGCSVAIYGFGDVGLSYLKSIMNLGYYKIVGIFDMRYADYANSVVKVTNPENVNTIEFDYILIANYDEKIAATIKKYLLDKGVEAHKIVYRKPIVLK